MKKKTMKTSLIMKWFTWQGNKHGKQSLMNLNKEKRWTVLIVQKKVKKNGIVAILTNGVIVSGGRDLEPHFLANSIYQVVKQTSSLVENQESSIKKILKTFFSFLQAAFLTFLSFQRSAEFLLLLTLLQPASVQPLPSRSWVESQRPRKFQACFPWHLLPSPPKTIRGVLRSVSKVCCYIGKN